MATTTPNFGWSVPTSTDLVKDGATAIETLGDAIDASMADLKGGTTGQVLKKATNTDMDFVWSADSAGMTNPMTTTGDTIYSSSGSTPARLGIGSTGQVLTVASGLPSWATPAAGGGFTTIASGSLSGNTLNLTSIPQTYKSIRLQLLNIKCSGSGPALQMTFNGEGLTGQSTYCETGVKTTQAGSASAYSPTGWSGSYSLLGLSGGFADSTTTLANLTLNWDNYSDTTSAKIGYGTSYFNYNTNATAAVNLEQILWRNANAISQITIKVESTNTYTSGTYILYGVN